MVGRSARLVPTRHGRGDHGWAHVRRGFTRMAGRRGGRCARRGDRAGALADPAAELRPGRARRPRARVHQGQRGRCARRRRSGLADRRPRRPAGDQAGRRRQGGAEAHRARRLQVRAELRAGQGRAAQERPAHRGAAARAAAVVGHRRAAGPQEVPRQDARAVGQAARCRARQELPAPCPDAGRPARCDQRLEHGPGHRRRHALQRLGRAKRARRARLPQRRRRPRSSSTRARTSAT